MKIKTKRGEIEELGREKEDLEAEAVAKQFSIMKKTQDLTKLLEDLRIITASFNESGRVKEKVELKF